MVKSKVRKKRDKKGIQPSSFYVALKSKNEIYFQMASIFKEASKDEDQLAKKIFNGLLMDDFPKIFVENSF